MPTLMLNRQCEIGPDPPDSVAVVCEAKPGLSTGWCARIDRDPDKPLATWSRSYLKGDPSRSPEGRTLRTYRDLPDATYEAHSMFRAGWASATAFAVAGGDLAILGRSGDEDDVIAGLNNLTVSELHEARKLAAKLAPKDPWDLPPLVGTQRQTTWAEDIRAEFLHRAEQAGDRAVLAALRSITDATWFIANRGRSLSQLRLPRSPAPA